MLDPDSTIPFIILAIFLILHAFFAAAKEAIASVKRSRRLQLMAEGHTSAQLVDNLAENATLLLTTEQLILKFFGFSIISIAITVYTIPLAHIIATTAWVAALIITTVFVFVVLFFGELIPKEVARQYPESIAFWTVYPFKWVSYVVTPLARMVTKVGNMLTSRWEKLGEASPNIITEEDLRSYVDVGEEEGVLKEDEKEMIYSIFDLDDTLAREVMVPRIDVIAVEANASIMEVIGLVIQAGHSRLPVYDDTIDNIVGILYVKDLLIYWFDDATQPDTVRELVRKVYYIPETKPVNDLLKELQAQKIHIAIVIDEYGGTAGLVTIEDILEEIVGEIQDEHDADEFFMQYISDDEYIFSAKMDLDDINDMMSLDLPTDDSDTLSGLIYDMFGRIPVAGDTLKGEAFGFPDLWFTVLEVEGRRIKSVKIKRNNKENEAEGEVAIKGPKPSRLTKNLPNTVSESS